MQPIRHLTLMAASKLMLVLPFADIYGWHRELGEGLGPAEGGGCAHAERAC